LIHKEGDLYIGSSLRELEDGRKKDLFGITLWMGVPILIIGLVIFWFYVNNRDPLSIVVGTVFCNLLFFLGLWRSHRIRKEYNSRIRRKIIVPLINEFIPEADTATGHSAHSVDSILSSRIVMNLNRSSYLSFEENGIVHIPLAGIGSVQFSDLEFNYGHGKHQRRLFDGLLGFLKARFNYIGSARFQVPARDWRQFPKGLFFISLVFLVAAGVFLYSGLTAAIEGIVFTASILIAGFVFLILAIKQYSRALRIEKNLEKNKKGLWWMDQAFRKAFPNLGPIEDRIHSFYRQTKSQTIVSFTSEGVFVAFPQITDFMEVSLGRSLTSKGLQKKWNNQVQTISLVVELIGELVGLLGGLYQPGVANLGHDQLEGSSVGQKALDGRLVVSLM